MIRAARRFYSLLRDKGPQIAARRSIEFALRRLYLAISDNPEQIYIDSLSLIAAQYGVNICHNEAVRRQYDESKTNVLIVTESPAVVEEQGWLDQDMEFHAEFSFGDHYELEHFYSLRRMHAGRDYWVSLDPSNPCNDKTELVSTVLSDKTRLRGQVMRHLVVAEYGDLIDSYGKGVDKHIEEKSVSLEPYMFQIVIENGKFPEYVSEKFFDCLKTNTIPIYWGGKEAVKEMGFDTSGILFFDDLGELEEILEDISESKYNQLRPQTEDNRDRLIEIRDNFRRDFYLSKIRLGSLRSKGEDESTTRNLNLRFS